MYAIYANEDILYSPRLIDDGCIVLKPKLTMELNKSGSLEFTLPTTNPMYGKLQKLKTIITLKQDERTLWKGRVLNDEKDFHNKKKTFCEGQLSFFMDSIVRPYKYSGNVKNLLSKYVTGHNSQVEEDKQFQIGTVNVEDSNSYIVRSSSQYPTTLDELMTKLPNSTLGGYISTTFLNNGKTAINYTSDPGGVSTQEIVFGENLLDITEYISAENVFTVLIPLGAKEVDEEGNEGERLTIASVNDGKDFIEDATAISLFGRITRTEVWDDVTLASNLLSKGNAYLQNGIKMAVTLSIKAVDLHLLDVNTDEIRLGDYIRVVSAPHGLDSYFLCSKIELDLVNPDKTVYTLGTGFRAMSEQQVASMKMANSAYSTAEAASSTANNASEAIATGDYVPRNEFTSFKDSVAKTYTAFPAVTTEDNGKVMKVINGVWGKGDDEKGGESGTTLPAVTESDNGKVLKVVNGQWTTGDDNNDTLTDSQLETVVSGKVTDYMEGNVLPKLPPTATEADEGKIMKIVDGKWAIADDDPTDEALKEKVDGYIGESLKENFPMELTEADEGKIMKVSGGKWILGEDDKRTDEELNTAVEAAVKAYVDANLSSRLLPEVTEADEGKIMKVTNGAWTLVVEETSEETV